MPAATPTLDSTIGMLNALAVLARRRTLSSTKSALVSERMGFKYLLLIIDQHQGAVLIRPDTEIFVHRYFSLVSESAQPMASQDRGPPRVPEVPNVSSRNWTK